MNADKPDVIVKDWTDPHVMAAEGDALVREGWEIAAREPIEGGVRITWRRRKTRVEDGQ